MSYLKHGHGSGGLDIPGLRYNYLYILVETCCFEGLEYTVVVSSGMDFPGYDLWIVGHVYGIVHVSLLMVWKITRRFWFCLS